MSIQMSLCKKRLGLVWFIGGGTPFLLMVVQSIAGFYGDRTEEAWGWLLSTIMPTISLIIGVLVADARHHSRDIGDVDTFIYRVTLWLSVIYLVIVSLTFVLRRLSGMDQLELMKLSHLWLAPLQGLVAATIGVFFVSKMSHRPHNDDRDTEDDSQPIADDLAKRGREHVVRPGRRR